MSHITDVSSTLTATTIYMEKKLFENFKRFLIDNYVLEPYIKGIDSWKIDKEFIIGSYDLIVGAFNWYDTNCKYNFNIEWNDLYHKWEDVLTKKQLCSIRINTYQLYQYLVIPETSRLSIF